MSLKLIDVTRNLLIIMPLIDTINGIIIGDSVAGVNLGQIYRMSILICLLLLLMKEHNISFMNLLVFIYALFILGAKLFLDINVNINEIGVMLKLFLPICIIEIISLYFRNDAFAGIKYIEDILKKICVLAPLTLIIPYLLGVGNATYDDRAGFKGFYYATNEIAFLLDILLIFLVFDFKPSIKWIIKFAMCIVSAFFVGTKTVLLVGMVCGMIVLIKLMNGKNISLIYKVVIIGTPTALILMFFYDIYEQFRPILERWEYGISKHEAEGVLFFLTSGRVARAELAWHNFINSDMGNILFGYGMTSEFTIENNCEMDFIDLMFALGTVSLLVTMLYYIKFAKEIFITDKKVMVTVFMCLFILIFFGGHVLFAGLGGMSLSMILIYLYFRNRNIISA